MTNRGFSVVQKLAALRRLMAAKGLAAYIVPSGDAHAGEYTAAYWRARSWLSGFTGSAGLLVVLRDEAGLWTDGRYFIQAERELAGSGIKLFKEHEPDVPKYQAFLAEKIKHGEKIGFDGRMLTATGFSRLKTALAQKNVSYIYEDLVNEIWEGRPQLPTEKAFEHAYEFSGKTSAEKLAEVREKMREKQITAYLVTTTDSVAWLTNLRGRDIPCLPVPYAFALITETAAHLFIDPAKVSEIGLPDFHIHAYASLPGFLEKFSTKKLYYNANKTNVLLAGAVPKGADAHTALKPDEDIIPLLKAVKSPTEIANIKNAFIKEGVVMTKTLCRLDSAITEADVARILQGFRSQQPHYLCDSFETIVAYGANAAQAHYSPGETGAALRPEGLLLIDTGGQYLDGTTDTTRTIPMGSISDEMRRDFTLVLKAHIGLARAVFPVGMTGSGIDALARRPLWEAGQNYSHGTGHGIGYCLSVHEGPHNISRYPSLIALAPGMLVTNEPAIYKENSHGIRTENVLLVQEAEYEGFLSFETLTYCPISTQATAPEMLTPTERGWLNAYNKKTRETLLPHLSEAEREWLKHITAEI